MTLTFSDLSIVGILGLIVIAAVTIRGRMWNKVHVLRSVGQMTDQAIMEDALRNAMPEPAQRPAQPTMESKLAELDRLRSSERISDQEYAAARARIIGSLQPSVKWGEANEHQARIHPGRDPRRRY